MTRRTMHIGDLVVVDNAQLSILGVVMDASANPTLTGNVAQNGAPAFRIHVLCGTRHESGAGLAMHDDVWIRDNPWHVHIDGVDGFSLPEMYQGSHVPTMLTNAGIRRHPAAGIKHVTNTAEARQWRKHIVIIVVCVAVVAAAIWIWYRYEHRTEVDPSIPLSQSYIRNCAEYISDRSWIKPQWNGNGVAVEMIDSAMYPGLARDDADSKAYECFARQIGYTQGESGFINEMTLATSSNYHLINDTFVMVCAGSREAGMITCGVFNRAFP